MPYFVGKLQQYFLKETFPIFLDSLHPMRLLNVTILSFKAFINRFIC